MIDYKEFENKEIDRFFKTNWSFRETRLILINLIENDFSDVQSATKKGIQKGTEEFLQIQNPRLETIYQADLHSFYFDPKVGLYVKKEVEELNLNLNNVAEYSDEMRKSYCFFLYNYGIKDFKKAAKKHAI